MTTIDRSGPVRVEQVCGQWYVLGGGWCLPARSAGTAAWLLRVWRGEDVVKHRKWKDYYREVNGES